MFLQALVTCIIKDERVEFQDFLGKPCKELIENHVIQRNGSYSGYNKGGYPQVRVEYFYKICNENKEARFKIQLTKPNTFAKEDDTILDELNNGGNMKGGNCRKASLITTLDSRERYHSATAQIDGFLFKGGKVFNGVDHPAVPCFDSATYKSRFQYDDDCNVKVR